MSHTYLSKYHFNCWQQCPKRLWLTLNSPELAAQLENPVYQKYARAEIRHVLTKLYPNAHYVTKNIELAVQQTQNLIAQTAEVIFDAVFVYRNFFVRADALILTASGYRIVDFLPVTSIKPHVLNDFIFKVCVITQSGFNSKRFELAYLNKYFVYLGANDYSQLFHFDDLSFSGRLGVMSDWINQMCLTVESENMPGAVIGNHCYRPVLCPFHAVCCVNAEVNAAIEFPLDALHRMSSIQKEKLRAKGYFDLRDVPESELNTTQLWIQRVSRNNQAELNTHARDSLRELSYPRYYFDFEAVTFAVPPWAQIKPLAGLVPYQWSCHVEDESLELSHYEFLDVSGNDPRRACAEQLIAILGNGGPIFVYSQEFERGRINELAALFPDLTKALYAINTRVVDLLPLTRSSYYHPAMLGSWSIKSVLPTIAPELDYAQLDIGNGSDAQQAYHEITDPETTEERRDQLIQGLLTYCQRDTLALVRLANFLQYAKT